MLQSTPLKNLFLLIFLQLTLWSVVPFLTSESLPLDVIREGLSWGKEWQAGYHKHPPFVSWAVHLSYQALGDFGPYLLSQICIAITYFFAYKTAKFYLSDRDAFLATLMLTGVYYFSWPTPEFNHNIAQMPIWAATIFLFHQIIFKNHQLSWLLVGLVLGIGILVKYSVLILPLLMFFYLMFSSKIKDTLKSPYPYLGIAIALLLIHQHIIWLIDHDFITLRYAEARASAPEGQLSGIISGGNFLLAQIADHLPLMIALSCAGVLHPSRWGIALDVKPKIYALFTFGLAPCLGVVLLAAISGLGLRDMWGAPMWTLSGVMVMVFLKRGIDQKHYTRLLRCFFGLFFLIITLFGASNVWHSQITNKPKRTDWPAAEIAERFDSLWEKNTGCGLHIVAGDNWLAGLVSAKGKNRPSVWIDGDMVISPWINKQRLLNQGALAIWRAGDARQENLINSLKQHGEIIQGEAETFKWKTFTGKKNKAIKPLVIDWMILKPENCLKK